MLNDALKLLKAGLVIVPLRAGTKRPHKDDWNANPIRTEHEARIWWRNNPRDGVGIHLAGSNVVGVDFDSNHGAKPEDLALFPRTVTTQSRHGFHLYFRHPDKPITCHALIPPLEGKVYNQAPAYLYTQGRQFVAPPTVVSFDEGGNLISPFEYRFHADGGGDLSFWDCPLADCPAWFFEAPGEKNQPGNKLVSASKHHEKVEYVPNTRHAMFVSTATAMRKKGKAAEEILVELKRRNSEDCNPPKTQEQNIDEELMNVVDWALKNVQPSKNQFVVQEITDAGEYVVPLGHKGTDYYYTSSNNKQIVTLSRSGHEQGLADLMPLSYWSGLGYEGKRGGLDRPQIASDLMEACRDVGFFDGKKIRGVGCWRDGKSLVVHLGDKLWVDGQLKSLNGLGSPYIYTLGMSTPAPSDDALNLTECTALVEACGAPAWVDKSSGMLLAGMLSVFRLCGALPWRPHGWLTGASGSGKTTVMERVILPIVGSSGLYTLGNTTEAGIRQELFCDARPVVFDEAEINDRRSANRMSGVLELVRQASSETQGRILKGTADGKGHSFKVNSSFLLSSIRFNLTEEADRNRFTVFELDRCHPGDWDSVQKKLDGVSTPGYGDRLFSRMVRLYPTLMASRQVFEDLIAERANRRAGQQYGILLAGYWGLLSDDVVSQEEALKLVDQLPMLAGNRDKDEDMDRDETEAVSHLMESVITYRDNNGPITQSVLSVCLPLVGMEHRTDQHLALRENGLDVDGTYLWVANRHPVVERIFRDTKWASIWSIALGRLPGAKKNRHRFGGGMQKKSIAVPLDVIFPKSGG